MSNFGDLAAWIVIAGGIAAIADATMRMIRQHATTHVGASQILSALGFIILMSVGFGDINAHGRALFQWLALFLILFGAGEGFWGRRKPRKASP